MADTKVQMLNDNNNDHCDLVTVIADTSKASVHNFMSFFLRPISAHCLFYALARILRLTSIVVRRIPTCREARNVFAPPRASQR